MVVVYSEAPISVLTDLQDFLLNNGADHRAPWDVEIKLYRANQASFKNEDKQRMLFTVWTSREKERVWILPRESGTPMSLPIMQILDTKLQSLWVTRQVFKGSGNTYICYDGSAIRVTNIFVQGSYKGLMLDADPGKQSRKLAEQIHTVFDIPKPKWDLDEVGQAREHLSVYR